MTVDPYSLLYDGDTYDIVDTRNNVLATIGPRQRNTVATSLVLNGRGYSTYGQDRNQNLVQLLENFSNTTPPPNPLDGQLWWDRSTQLLRTFDPLSAAGSPAWRLVVPPSSGIGFSVVGGDGLSAVPVGGLPDGSPLIVTLNIGAGTGITVSADAISTNDSQIDHDALSGFVGNEHTDHSTVDITAGDGLTGGGNITTNRTLTVETFGTGLLVNSTSVAVDTSTRMVTNFNHRVSGQKTFTSPIRGSNSTSTAAPAFSFSLDTNTGIYRTGTNQLSFSTGSSQRFRIESNGVLRSLNSNYESLVTNADDIPNKKYVDDLATASSTPTENTFVGTSSISGLSGLETYLVNVYGVIPSKGTGNFTLSAITLRRGSTTPGSGTVVDSTPQQLINWPDGDAPTEAAFVAEMNGDTTLNCIVNSAASGGGQRNATLMTAVQITEYIPPGSPSALGVIELDDVNGATSPLGTALLGLGQTAFAAVRFNGSTAPSGAAEHDGYNSATPASLVQIGNDWLISGSNADYEIRVESISLTGSLAGASVSGTLGAWLDLDTTNRVWILSKAPITIGSITWNITIEIRQKTDISITTGAVPYALQVEML